MTDQLSIRINHWRPDDAIDEALNLQSSRIGRVLRDDSIGLSDLGGEIRGLSR